jgi:hypothetical protein
MAEPRTPTRHPHPHEEKGAKVSRFTSNATIDSARIRRFARHYVEMVIAMFAGMFVLGVPLAGVLELAGSSLCELERSTPAVYLLAMGVSMTAGMVVWMRYRGHGWRPSSEMAGAMMGPTFAVIVLLGFGIVDFGAAMMIEHVAMLPAMLAVMLARWDEYSAPHDHRRPTRRETDPSTAACPAESA